MSDIPPQASTDAQAAQAPMQQHEQSSMSASGQPAQLSPEGENGQASGPSGAAANSNMSGPSGPSSGGPGPAGGPPAPAGQAPLDSQAIRHMNEVLASDIGVATMLTRLKASIASAKEFALFLRKRASIEEEHSSALRKLCRTTQANMHGSGEHRGGSFARAYDEMIFIHERLADNGSRFATSLHQMHDDLWELAAAAERGRKAWKANGLQAENRVVEIESQLRKSKAKYDALADEYERVRAGEAPGPSASGSGGSKLLGALKGATKSAAHHEEDLFRKVQGADSEYFQKVQSLQSERADLVAKTRPEAVRALQDIVKETDAGLTLQLQKYGKWTLPMLTDPLLSILFIFEFWE